MAVAWPNLYRPHVVMPDGEEHVAGQLVIQLAQSQRDLINLSKQDGVALFGIPALDELSRKWKVDDITRLMGNPHPNEIDKRLGCDLQFVIQFGEDQDIAPVAAEYRARPEVDVVCPNGVMHLYDTPDDSLFPDQWHYQTLKATYAWTVAKGDTSVVNCVLDDGIDYDHPDIQANFAINHAEDINHNGVFDSLPAAQGGDIDGIDQDGDGYADDVIGYDFTDGDPNPFPHGSDTHGTHCWGITNAVTNDGIGVSGTTWNSRSVGVRCGNGESVFLSAAVAGIYYGFLRNVFSYSMSFGGTSPYAPLVTAGEDATDNGSVLFGAAGNDGLRVQRYPGCDSDVQCVASSGNSDKKSGFSNWGPWIDVSAPGEGILSTKTRSQGSYGTMDGTSMATPLAAGVACWIKSMNPSLTNQEVIDKLHAACDTMPDSLFRIGELGAGRVSLGNVVLPLYYTDLKLENWRFNDASGNNNGRPDPGETVALIVTYHNTAGWRDASGVYATLTTAASGIEIAKDTARFPDIPNGTSGDCSADSFVINIPSSVPPQHITFNLVVHATPDPAYPNSSFEVQVGAPRVLIVDDAVGADYGKYYTAACDSNGVLHDDYNVQSSGSPSADTLKHYPVVIWFTGDDSTTTLTSTDEANLGSYLDNGGNLMISGQNIAYDIAGDAFLANYLHAQFSIDSAGATYMVGVQNDPITGEASRADTMVLGGANGANNSRSEDGVFPANGGIGCAYYKGYADTTVQGVVHFAGAYHVVFFSCAFEALDHSTTRYLQKWTLIARILKFFGEKVPGVAQGQPTPDINPYVLKISPSPFSKIARVEFTAPISGRMQLRTFSTDGRLVASQNADARMGQHVTFYLDALHLANGIYLVQLSTPAGLYARKTAVLK
jgi:hypothetical protein